jgi:hypothetical protein
MMTESEIWQIIQTGNEISVLRTELFITITVGVLIVSSINVIKVNTALLVILLGSYCGFGYINFSMLINEMEILIAGMIQIHTMALEGQDISLMGRYLAGLLDSPRALPVVPALQFSYWFVTVSTVSYSIWMYRRQSQ